MWLILSVPSFYLPHAPSWFSLLVDGKSKELNCLCRLTRAPVPYGKTVVEDRGLDVGRASPTTRPLISSWDEPRVCRLWGGPKRPLTPRSVTHLPLSFIGAETQLVHWICADETSYQPLLQHFNNNASVRFPFSCTLHMDGGQSKATL